ncbi:helix-turn-helix transcriptional regulator [Candidatus Kaiserbacteria bacterium]|nr:helix-turn-helix transcriptional regulator [Candidatus Kaiserbacteria bacterium]
MQNTKREPLVSIGLMSGLNYGSQGCREGLWRLAATTFAEEGVDFVVLAGGLVDSRSLLEQLKLAHVGVKRKHREEATDDFIDEHVDHLVEEFPRLWGKKLYIMTSPAYDGWIGERIASELVRRRDDLRLYRPGADRFELEHNDKPLNLILGVYAPKKGVWMRGDYFSTPIMRQLKDEMKRGTRGMGDINTVGCFASAIFNPGDASELKLPFFSLPALYKIAETRTAENQIGIRVLNLYSKKAKEATLITYNFKDLVSQEWELIHTPPDSTRIQEELVAVLKERGPQTAGQFADLIEQPRATVGRALDKLVERRRSKSWPGIIRDENSKRYTFYLPWFQQDLEYPVEEIEKVDSILGFGCLHAACVDTDMKYFRDEVPKVMLESGADILCGAGDFIEGLRHDLMLKNAILNGDGYMFNYTNQEKLAAYLVSEVLTTVFRARWNARKAKAGDLEESILKALPTFLYIPGNHCEWVAPEGFNSLATFGDTLRRLMTENVVGTLAEAKIYRPDLAQLVNRRIIRLEPNQRHLLASGLSLAMLHPYMSRTKTTSIRPQEMLTMANTNIVIGANFHVAEAVEEWKFDQAKRCGQQHVCLQVGTLKHKSDFENTKLKIVDFGVGLLKVGSLNGKIKRTETTFLGTPTPESQMRAANKAVREAFEERVRPT